MDDLINDAMKDFLLDEGELFLEETDFSAEEQPKETTDESKETDEIKETTDKTSKTAGKPNETTSKPEETDETSETVDKLKETTDITMGTDEISETADKPKETTDIPMETDDKPIDIVDKPMEIETNSGIMELGVYDDPKHQLKRDISQGVFMCDIYTTHIAVFGISMSGKTNFLKNLILRLHEKSTSRVRVIYILDFFGHLRAYSDFPYVVAYFDNSNEENIRRLFKNVEKDLEDNGDALKSGIFSATPEIKRPPHITLIIDGLNPFLAEDRFATQHESLLRICREGLSKGITVVFTATDTVGASRYLTSVKQKVAFELPSDKYADVFGFRVDKPMAMPGRGVVNIETSAFEFQCFLPFDDRDGKDVTCLINEYETRCPAVPYRRKKMLMFDPILKKEDVDKFCISDGEMGLGIDYHTFEKIKLDIKTAGSIAIFGKRKFGKTNLLSLLLEASTQADASTRIVFFEDGRNGLKEVYDEKIPRFLDKDALLDYFYDNGYYCPYKEEDRRKDFIESQNNPFTVFVVQARSFFRGDDYVSSIYLRLREYIDESDIRNVLFIFSDARPFSNNELMKDFNDIVRHYFLLDDVARFSSERGKKTVFGDMDVKELKEAYGQVRLGDGYYYDFTKDSLHKVKFVKNEKLG